MVSRPNEGAEVTDAEKIAQIRAVLSDNRFVTKGSMRTALVQIATIIDPYVKVNV